MIKSSGVRQSGIFRHGSKSYRFVIERKPKEELYNFYTDNEDSILVCSVFTSYLSKTIGVRKAGAFEREVYGVFDVYVNFLSTLDTYRRFNTNVLSDSKLIMDEKTGDFIHYISRSSSDSKFMHLQYSLENFTQKELIQVLSDSGSELVYIDYDISQDKSKVLCKKEPDLTYSLRESGESDTRRQPIKTLDMISIEKDISWLDSKVYKIINTVEEFDLLVSQIANIPEDEILGYDTETTGLRINRFPVGHPKRDKLVGICLSWEDDIGYYVPIAHKLFENIDESYCIEKLRPYLCSTSPLKKNLVTHNGKFDWRVMFTYGIKLNIIHDTLLLFYLINNSEFRKRKDLKTLAYQLLGMDMVELEDNYIKQKGVKIDYNFANLPYENVRAYAPADADATRLICKHLVGQLPKQSEFIYYIEVELMKSIAKMEYNGIRLDIESIMRDKVEAQKKKDSYSKKIFELVGYEFNINSGPTLAKIMFTDLKYPVYEYTEKNMPKTGKRTLNLLMSHFEKDSTGKLLYSESGEKVFTYPLANLLKKYKDTEKLLNGFLTKMIDENVDGFIFPSYDQTGTDSGRISCSGPNLQQTPGKSREAIIPDSDDYYFLIVDYSQVEYRIMAGLGGELDIINSFSDPETDHHVNMYAKMFNKHPDDVTSTDRKIGKLLNFGVTYGMSPPSLAILLFDSSEPDKVAEATRLIKLYFDSVPYIRDMLEETKDFATLFGYVETKFGRRRHFPDIKGGDFRTKDANRRKAANTRVQGTGADILKISHVKVEREIEKLGLDVTIKISMHDELVLQVPKSINPWYMLQILRNNMELKIEGFPPLFLGANVGGSWAVGKRDDLEIPTLLSDKLFLEGEHLKAPYADPEKQVELQIKDYIYSKLLSIVQEKQLNTVEKSLANPTIHKMLKDYFGCKSDSDFSEFMTKTLNGESISLGTGQVLYNDTALTFYEDSEYEDEEKTAYFNLDALREVKNFDMSELELPDTEMTTAVSFFKTNYEVMVIDRVCYIDVTGVQKEGLTELKNYFVSNHYDKGIPVQLVMDNKFIETPFKLYKIEKMDIIFILDTWKSKRNIS